jgi:hypothetical protein
MPISSFTILLYILNALYPKWPVAPTILSNYCGFKENDLKEKTLFAYSMTLLQN